MSITIVCGRVSLGNGNAQPPQPGAMADASNVRHDTIVVPERMSPAQVTALAQRKAHAQVGDDNLVAFLHLHGSRPVGGEYGTDIEWRYSYQPTTAGSRSPAHPPHRAADTPSPPARRPVPSPRTSRRPAACAAPPAGSRPPPPSHRFGGRRSPARASPACPRHRSSAAKTAGTRCRPRSGRSPDSAGDRVPTKTQTPHGRR